MRFFGLFMLIRYIRLQRYKIQCDKKITAARFCDRNHLSFVELEKEVLPELAVFIKKVLPGTCTRTCFMDSTPLRVCRNQRILIHKSFKGLAQRGKILATKFYVWGQLPLCKNTCDNPFLVPKLQMAAKKPCRFFAKAAGLPIHTSQFLFAQSMSVSWRFLLNSSSTRLERRTS